MTKRKIIHCGIIASAVIFTSLISLSFLNPEPERQIPSFQVSPAAASGNTTIIADLSKMKLSLYQNEQLIKEFEILTKPEKGSPWEMPSGKYSIIRKEKNYFSPMADSQLAYTIQLWGNSLIHANSSKVGIELKTKEAKEVFQFVNPETDVLVKNDSYDENPKTALDEKNSYFLRPGKNSFPQISARAFLIGDLKTGAMLKQKNENEVLPIASLSKLMTALVALENINPNKEELLYPLLLESSNDAAFALAEGFRGSTSAAGATRGRTSNFAEFVSSMNSKARTLGLNNTFFEEPAGLSENNVSSAKDLFQLAQYLYNNQKKILDITRLKKFNSWTNNNPFTENEQYLGGKTGYNDKALKTSVSLFSLPLAEFENREIAIILLGSQNWKKDAMAVLNWLKSKVFYQPELPQENRLSKQALKKLTARLEQISLLFVGDIMLGRDVERMVAKKARGNFSFLFEKADFLKKPDITFANLEGPISDIGEDRGSLYSFRFHPTALDALKQAGFDALSVANNHTADWGKAAFEDTALRLRNENIMPVGADSNPIILERKGIKIGFLGFSEIGPDWFQIDQSFGEIIKTGSEKADILVVSLHFGEEYQEAHNQKQEELAYLAIDNGAKIVVGHHPHVIQEVELYKDGLIAYSLGNFVFDQVFSEETQKGLGLEVIVSGEGKIKSFTKNIIKINKLYQPELSK